MQRQFHNLCETYIMQQRSSVVQASRYYSDRSLLTQVVRRQELIKK